MTPKRYIIILFMFISQILLTIFLISNYSPHQIMLLAIILSLYSLFLSSIGFLIAIENITALHTEDLAIIASFSAMLYATNFFSMLLPSLTFYIIPFAAGLAFYLPASILYGAFQEICRKKGSSFLLLIGYGFISMFFSPAIFWFPYFLAWGSILEITGLYSKKRNINGFFFGFTGANLAIDYMLVAWGYWRPLFIVIPAIIGDGILTIIGYKFGTKLGEELVSIIH